MFGLLNVQQNEALPPAYFDETLQENSPLQNVFELDYGGKRCYFVLGESYSGSDSIVVVPSATLENTYYFIPNNLYANLDFSSQPLENRQVMDYTHAEPYEIENPLYDNQETNDVEQFFIYLSLFIVGCFFLAMIKKGTFSEKEIVLAFPTGIALHLFLCVLLFFFNIPSIKTTYICVFLAFCVLAISVLFYKIKEGLLHICGLRVGIAVLIFVLFVAFFVYFNEIRMSNDSGRSASIAVSLTYNHGYLPDGYLMLFNTYGFLSITLSVLEYALGVGILYAVYPLVYFHLIFLLGISIYGYAKKNQLKFPLVAGVLSAGSILFISEFAYHYFWLLNNMAVGLFMLILIHTILHASEETQTFSTVIGSLFSCVIFFTRTEGAVFVALLLGSALLLKGNTRTLCFISLTTFLVA